LSQPQVPNPPTLDTIPTFGPMPDFIHMV
jgi:hypothetical protein